MHIAVAVLALGNVGVTLGGRFGVDAVLIRGLLVTVAGGANGLGWRRIVRDCFDIRVAICASEGTVYGRLELRIVHMQADLLPILVFRKRWVAMTGQTILVAQFRGFSWPLRSRRPCHRRQQRSKYYNPTATLHRVPLTFSQPSRRLPGPFTTPTSGFLRTSPPR